MFQSEKQISNRKLALSVATAILALLLCTVSAYAPFLDSGTNLPSDHMTYEEVAEALYGIGLINGTGLDATGKPMFELYRIPTRAEALTVLLRMLGKEQEIQGAIWDHPFTDVPEWAAPYVGYGYQHKLTGGIDETLFGSDDPATAEMFVSFMLRSMGYDDLTGQDFTWDNPWSLSAKIQLAKQQERMFTRGDMMRVIYNSLFVMRKDGHVTGNMLIESGVISWEDANNNGIVFPLEETPVPLSELQDLIQTGTDENAPGIYAKNALWAKHLQINENVSGWAVAHQPHAEHGQTAEVIDVFLPMPKATWLTLYTSDFIEKDKIGVWGIDRDSDITCSIGNNRITIKTPVDFSATMASTETPIASLISLNDNGDVLLIQLFVLHC